ncbi:mitochondrial import inner membrane translocase subunit TIM22 [Pancytospora epiphaga]|nr:mitochondrial import inner membrane translocase subunit TIM22 [Pancytospora epiphaga]
MFKTKIRKMLADMRPCAEKLVLDSAKGYVFGCLVGVFVPSNKPLGSAMHDSGKTFAKMSAAYSVTDMTLTRLRNKKDIYNSLTAGAIAGGIGSKHGQTAGICLFGAYSGIMHHFSS